MTRHHYFSAYHRAVIKQALRRHCSASAAAIALRRFETHASRYRAAAGTARPTIGEVCWLWFIHEAALQVESHLLQESNGYRIVLQKSRGLTKFKRWVEAEYPARAIPGAETGKERLCLYLRLADMAVCESVNAAETMVDDVWEGSRPADHALRHLCARVASDWAEATGERLPLAEGVPAVARWDRLWAQTPNPLWMVLDAVGIPMCAQAVNMLVDFTIHGERLPGEGG